MRRLTALVITFCIVWSGITAPSPVSSASLLLRVPEDYASIQAAVDAAEPGMAITVGPGTYTENVSIRTSGVVLAAPDGANVTRIVASDPADHAVTISATNVTLHGFTISGATGDKKAGVCIVAGGDRAVITGNTLDGNNVGFVLSQVGGCQVWGNTCTGNVVGGGGTTDSCASTSAIGTAQLMDASGLLRTLRLMRDRVVAPVEVATYYQISPALCTAFFRRPDLGLRAGLLLAKYRPAFALLAGQAGGRDMAVSAEEVRSLRTFTDSLAGVLDNMDGGDEAAATIRQLASLFCSGPVPSLAGRFRNSLYACLPQHQTLSLPSTAVLPSASTGSTADNYVYLNDFTGNQQNAAGVDKLPIVWHSPKAGYFAVAGNQKVHGPSYLGNHWPVTATPDTDGDGIIDGTTTIGDIQDTAALVYVPSLYSWVLPAAPAGASIRRDSTGATLQWNAPANSPIPISGYYIYGRQVQEGPSSLLASVPADQMSWHIPDSAVEANRWVCVAAYTSILVDVWISANTTDVDAQVPATGTFTADIDGYAFKNGVPALSYKVFGAFYGLDDSVFSTAAKANIDDRIKDLSGACYGMAVTAVENFVKPDLQPQPLAYRLPSLVPVLYAASNGMRSAYWPAISYAAISQYNPAMAAYSSRFDGRDPNACLQRIQSELDRNGTCVVALVQTFVDWFSNPLELIKRQKSPTTTGHALVAYNAVQAPGSANWNVCVYDCNYPGDTQKYIHFDTASNTWTYFTSITENHLRPIWHGEAGSPAGEMIVLPAEEVLDYLRPVASTATQMGHIQVNTVGAYTMTDAAGHSAGWNGTSLFNNIPGLILSPTFSNDPQAISYLAPESLGDIRIAMDVVPGFQSSLTISNGKSTWKEVDATTASKSESAKLTASLDPEGVITVTGSGQEQMVTVRTSSTVGGTAGALIGVQSVNLPPGATCEISPGVDGRGVSVRSSTDTQYQVTVATESVATSWVSATLWTTGGSTQHVDAIPTGRGVPQQLQVGTDSDSNGVVDSTAIVLLAQGITAPQGVQVSVQERNAVLTWMPSVSSGSVTGYAVYRSMMPGVELVEPITRLSASVATFTDTALTEGHIYYYSVRAYTGAASPTYSEPSAQVAAVVPDTTAPGLTIQQPQDQISCDTDTVVVAGTATDAGAGVASLTVNGQAVSMFLDGAFSTDVPLVEGANTIAVICTDDAGNVTQVTRTVIRTLGQTATTIVLTIDSTQVFVNGVTQAIDAAPVIRSGRTFVPIRFISETVGAQVTWDAGTQMVGVALSSHHVELQIGSTRAVVDGALSVLEAPPFIDHSRTMVPLRLISEAFGAEVSWDPVSRQVTVRYNRQN